MNMIEYYELKPDITALGMDYLSWIFKIPYEFYKGYEEGLKYEFKK